MDDYHNKVQDFIDNNNFTILGKDPTKLFQNRIKATIKDCQEIIHKDNKMKYTNLNSTAPNIRGLPKVHKEGCPIQPIINWHNAPAYKLTKLLNKLVQLYVLLPNTFNVKSSVHLINDLLGIPYKKDLQLISFDIENMYPSIPTDELVRILKGMCIENQLEEKTTNELIKITYNILEQNYFTFRNQPYFQNTGLAMGAPSSAVLSEVYLQHLEHTEIIKIIM